jgi:anti-anti-sigma regulatory factor
MTASGLHRLCEYQVPRVPAQRMRRIFCSSNIMPTFTREIIGQTIVVTLRIQSLDAQNVREVVRGVTAAMPGADRIVVDFGALQYFDVGGFGAILFWAQGGPQKAEVRMCSGSGTIRALFELLRAQTVVPLYKNREEAMASFARAERRPSESKPVRIDGSGLPGQRIA